MTPQRKTLVGILAGALFAGSLGLYAYFGVSKPEEVRQRQKDAEEKLFNRPASSQPPAAQKLKVQAKGETSVLEKKGAEWVLSSPLATKADEATVTTLVSQLESARFKSVVEEAPSEADLEKYGLKSPKFTVKATFDGGVELTVYGGIENTFDGSVYLRREGDKRIYAAPGSVRVDLEKGSYELRDKTVVDLDDSKLKAIDVRTPKNRYALKKGDSGQWVLTQPPGAADALTVSRMLSALKNEKALSFPLGGPDALSKLGLTHPALDATFVKTDGKSLRLRIGKALTDGTERAYALKEEDGSQLLAEVSLGSLLHLDKSPAELKDKSVLSFKTDAVAKLLIHPGPGKPPLLLQKMPADAGTQDNWELTAPQKGPAKKWKVSSLLWSLSSMRASTLGPEHVSNWGKYGLDGTAPTAELQDAQGHALAKLWVGKPVPGQEKMVYVRGSRGQVLEVEAARLSELPKSVEDLLEPPNAAVQDAGSSAATASH